MGHVGWVSLVGHFYTRALIEYGFVEVLGMRQ